ncbi:hypothetical protein Q8F55_005420 [Vanrija albida]|uniref:Uncharacterized protein n=1 Tax=Vanrija albida TaxID=181172 RepID=A0ABR3Q2D4_9TREE
MSTPGVADTVGTSTTPTDLTLRASAQHNGLQWAADRRRGSPLAPLVAVEEQFAGLMSGERGGGRGSLRVRTRCRSLDELDSVIAHINAARIAHLTISLLPTSSLPLDERYLARLLARLRVPHLQTLTLTTAVERAAVGPLAGFVRRSPGLSALAFDGARLDASDLDTLAAAAGDNPTVSRVCAARSVCSGLVECACALGVDLEAHGARVRRVHDAVRAAVVPARILLRARPAEEEDNKAFRLLELPAELVLLVVRWCSRDPAALSPAQWTALIQHAQDPAALSLVGGGVRAALIDGLSVEEARTEWLMNGGFW